MIDFGVMFPDATMPGVDSILPDTAWLAGRADDVAGLIITHAHEDHVGGVARFVSEIGAPVFGSPLTIAICEHKLTEARLRRSADLHVLADGERRRIGPFDVEVLPITHSVPQSLCVVVHTPQGVLVHTGDFKLDKAPVDGRLTDLGRLAGLADGPGVRLLMADSTNADGPGSSASETEIGETFRRLFPTYAGRRLLVACFASHLHRVQQVVDVATAEGRSIFPVGRSMVNNIRIARELGVLTVPEHLVQPIGRLRDFDPGEVCILCTGSQGEERAALALMANGAHNDVHIGDGDVVMLSSHPIPGNERAVFAVVNRLCRLGATVVHDGHEKVHTSGHARRDELAEMHRTVRPEWFVPIEGEYHMLARHAELAVETGLDPSRVLVVTDGAQLKITDDGVAVAGEVPAPGRFVDGTLDDVTPDLLMQRRRLSQAGMVHVTVVVDSAGGLLCPPEISTQGWIDTEAGADLLRELRAELTAAVERPAGKSGGGGKDGKSARAKSGRGKHGRGKHGQQDRRGGPDQDRDGRDASAGKVDVKELRRQVRRTVGRFVGDRTRRRTVVSVSVAVVR